MSDSLQSVLISAASWIAVWSFQRMNMASGSVSKPGNKASAATGLGSAKRTPIALEKIVRSKLDSHGLPGLPIPGKGKRK